MSGEDTTAEVFQEWYASLSKVRKGFPSVGVHAGALVVLERLKTDYNLDIDTHLAKGKAQILGLSARAVAKILQRFGETRPLLAEGGRTNRGLPGQMISLLKALVSANLDAIAQDERVEALTELQRFLVSKVQEYHSRQRLKFIFDPSRSTAQLVKDLLLLATETGKRGAVAQYLVGAKLQLRFPHLPVSNDSSSAADVQSGRHGDFLVGDTVFHVTVAPMQSVYDKCKRNIQSGLRPYLLVSEEEEAGAKSYARLNIPQVSVESIESFVSQNLEELSEFSPKLRAKRIYELLVTYNARVDAIEADKSLMVDVPDNLALSANAQ